MIRFIKHLNRDQIKKFKGEIPSHSCIISVYSSSIDKMYPENTDKVLMLDKDKRFSHEYGDEVMEFIMSVHERRLSNTTCYSEDYTIAKFMSDTLRIQKGRFTSEFGGVLVDGEMYDILEIAYKEYVFGGVMP